MYTWINTFMCVWRILPQCFLAVISALADLWWFWTFQKLFRNVSVVFNCNNEYESYLSPLSPDPLSYLTHCFWLPNSSPSRVIMLLLAPLNYSATTSSHPSSPSDLKVLLPQFKHSGTDWRRDWFGEVKKKSVQGCNLGGGTNEEGGVWPWPWGMMQWQRVPATWM